MYFFFTCHSDYELLRKRDLIDLFFNARVYHPIEITLLVPFNFMGSEVYHKQKWPCIS